MVEWWWTFEHFYMPEGIPLTTLIKVIIGAIGACQMPSLPSQLPRSPWTQLHTSWRGLDAGERRGWWMGLTSTPACRDGWRGGILTIWNTSSISISQHTQDVRVASLHCWVAQVSKELRHIFIHGADGWCLTPSGALCEIGCQSQLAI